MQRITPCLWFDHEAEEAATFYTGIFNDSRIGALLRYGNEGQEIHGGTPGSVLMIEFELQGQPFAALNGGPAAHFNQAISFQVPCETQEEIDQYWDKLSEGGDPGAQQCGWLKDRFGVSWQVFPAALPKMLRDPDTQKADRAMKAMMNMKKLDLNALQRAYDGQPARAAAR